MLRITMTRDELRFYRMTRLQPQGMTRIRVIFTKSPTILLTNTRRITAILCYLVCKQEMSIFCFNEA